MGVKRKIIVNGILKKIFGFGKFYTKKRCRPFINQKISSTYFDHPNLVNFCPLKRIRSRSHGKVVTISGILYIRLHLCRHIPPSPLSRVMGDFLDPNWFNGTRRWTSVGPSPGEKGMKGDNTRLIDIFDNPFFRTRNQNFDSCIKMYSYHIFL